MSSNRDGMDCPHCGWEGAVQGNEGNWYNVEQCGLCGYNEASPGESLYSYAHEEVVNTGLDEDNDEEEYNKAKWKIIDNYLDGEAGKNKIPNEKDIADSKIKQYWFQLACQASGQDAGEWSSWHDLEWCDIEELPIKIIEAFFEE